MPRFFLMLQAIEHGKTGLIGQADIQHDRAWTVIPGEVDRFLCRSGDNALEPQFARQFANDAGEGRVVLDDEQQPLAFCEGIAIVVEHGGLGWRGSRLRWR